MKNSKPLPRRAHSAAIPGSRANAKLKSASHTKPVQIDHSFVANPLGGPEKVIGNSGHIHIKGDKPKHTR